MIDVVVIEDDQELLDSLKILINGTPNLCCAGAYTNCESAIKNLEIDLPDVILLDIELPGISGVEGIRHIKKILPDVEIIMLTVHEDNEFVFESLKNGASGYLVKNVPFADLLTAIQEVYEGGSPMSMNIARMVVNSFQKNPPQYSLTRREKEVLQKLCEGKSYQAIANELFIAKTTVKFHIRNIYKILHVSNKGEAISKAKDDGVV